MGKRKLAAPPGRPRSAATGRERPSAAATQKARPTDGIAGRKVRLNASTERFEETRRFLPSGL
jgi:hypothetical protein